MGAVRERRAEYPDGNKRYPGARRSPGRVAVVGGSPSVMAKRPAPDPVAAFTIWLAGRLSLDGFVIDREHFDVAPFVEHEGDRLRKLARRLRQQRQRIWILQPE